MRNTTMLKAVLLKYTLHIEMDDSEQFTVKLTDKQSQASAIVTAGNYSGVIRKAYSYLLQDLKNSEQGL